MRIRPGGSGGQALCAPFLRATTSPRAALLFSADVQPPADWPTTTGISAADAQLSHAVGWVCEVRADHIVLLNPLGEGLFRAPLPPLSDAWLSEVRTTASTAIYLLDSAVEGATPQRAIDEAALRGRLPAASVRTAIAETYGQKIGRAHV